MRNGRLHCGVDIGTTNLKAVLVNESGRSVAMRAAPTPRLADGGGTASDALAILADLERLIAAAWHDAEVTAPLASIAVTGVGEDGVGVDASLAPTGLVLPWFDARGEAEAREFDPAVAMRAGLGVDSSRTAAKWLWLRRNRAQDLLRARFWLALSDFPAARWTGVPFMSETLAARTACFDVYRREWIEAALVQAGAPPLPPVLTAGTPLGGMRPGPLTDAGVADTSTVVAAGGHDHPAAAWAIRNQFAEARVDSMGTANLLYTETAEVLQPHLDPFLAFSVPVDGGRRTACLGVFGFAAELAPFDELPAALAANRLPGRPTPTGELAGGRRSLRGALDACGLHARRMLDAATEAGSPAGPICATGGWSRSPALMEQRASIFGAPVRVVREPELTAVAAAMLGARACGRTLPLGAAAQTTEVEPLPAWAAAYDEIYAAFRPILDAKAGAQPHLAA